MSLTTKTEYPSGAKQFGRLLLYGFLSWVVTFGGSVCLFPLKSNNQTTFETLIGVVLTISTVLFTVLYFRRAGKDFVKEGVRLGVSFLVCNILFDLPMFLAGPMKMPLGAYMKDIGLAYLSMPVISVGFALGVRRELC
jgi:hypothetical protein